MSSELCLNKFILTLEVPNKIAADDTLIFFILSSEGNKPGWFMQILCLTDESREI